MIRPEEAPKVRIEPHQIPDEVVEAVARASATQLGINWGDAGDFIKNGWRSDARIAIAVAIAAWPGAEIERDKWKEPRTAHLPLPPEAPQERINQESSDE